jgi:hypothetical protein
MHHNSSVKSALAWLQTPGLATIIISQTTFPGRRCAPLNRFGDRAGGIAEIWHKGGDYDAERRSFCRHSRSVAANSRHTFSLRSDECCRHRPTGARRRDGPQVYQALQNYLSWPAIVVSNLGQAIEPAYECERHDGASLRHALVIDETKSGIGSGQKKSLRHT